MPGEVLGQRLADLGREQRAGAHVDRQEGPLGPAVRAQRGTQRGGLERRPEAGAMRLVEPLVGRPERPLGHPRERLVAGDAPGRELEHGLEDGDDRVLAREQRLDLGALAVAGELSGEPAVVAPALVAPGALGPVQGAVGELQQAPGVARVLRVRGHAGRAGERRCRRRRPRRSRRAPARRPPPPASPSTPGRISANSSPPSRATRSSSRTAERSFCAAATSTLSPSAWP